MVDKVCCWRWRLVERRPPTTLALLVGEAVRAALIASARRGGMERLPDDFHHGRDTPFWLPEDEDCDGLIDHVVVYSRAGIPAELLPALARTDALFIDRERYALAASEMGARAGGRLFGPARSWRATTPFVTRLWRHGRRRDKARSRVRMGKLRPDMTPEAQLQREIVMRGLPAPNLLAWAPAVWLDEALCPPQAFALRRRNAEPPGDAVAGFPVLRFQEPQCGPMAFGFGSHFGLGLLVPDEEEV
jgi:CRISPR-associated protein Csb2